MKSAILFLVFNRPEPTKKVFEAIRSARPPKLYVAADGSRANRPSESALCAETRRVATAVDWPCEIQTLFRKENLGCKHAVSQAVSWFFDNETEGVILEDDCLPNDSFFRFCDEMLEYYRDDAHVGFITGDNFQGGRTYGDASYYFSRYPHIWGWASWRRSWARYDVNASTWPAFRDGGGLQRVLDGRARDVRYWTRVLDEVHAGRIDTWDYQVTLAAWVHGMLVVIPQTNLISNIGFGADATHTVKRSKLANLRVVKLSFPLTHPPTQEICAPADRITAALMYFRPIRAVLRSAVGLLLKRLGVGRPPRIQTG